MPILQAHLLNIWAFLIDQLVKNHLQCRRPGFNSWVGKTHWRRDRLPTPVFLSFPCGSAGKESACTAGYLVSIPGLGRSSEKGKGYSLQYSGLENSVDCIVLGVAKSWTQLILFLIITRNYFLVVGLWLIFILFFRTF